MPLTVLMAVIAATAIREAISVYSIAVAALSSAINRRKKDSIGVSEVKDAGVEPSPVEE